MKIKEHWFLGSLWCLLLLGLIIRFSLLGGRVALPELALAKEIFRLGLALAVVWGVSHLSSSFLKKWSRLLIFTSLLLLVLMQAGWAYVVNGAARWIDLGGIRFQPAEFVKVALLVYFADFLTRHRRELMNFWKGLLPALFILLVAFVLVVKQPDFGTSVLMLLVGFWMMWVAGVRLRYLMTLGLLALPGLGWLVLSQDYRLERLQAWFEPGAYLQDLGYQVNQSKWAIREGGLWGKGLVLGDARHGYLPESSSDFIGAIWIEETGLIGLMILLALFSLLISQMMAVALSRRDSFDRLLAAGASLLLASQILINLGVITSLIPNKGIPLPLVSSGGSSLLASACLIGFVWRMIKEDRLRALEKTSAELVDFTKTRVWNGL